MLLRLISWPYFRKHILRTMLTTAGIVIGVPAALLAARLVADRLFGVTATDIPTIVAASLSLLAVTAIAGFIPARRAARVDPVVALRAN